MNLKEEIYKERIWAIIGDESDEVISLEDAESVAESYAKEKAWGVWEHLMLGHMHPIKDEWIKVEKELFEKWWEENK